MLSHGERVDVARSVVDYLMNCSAQEMSRRVPNCPGWTVYNAAVHVGRAGVAWEAMMRSAISDSTARERAFAKSDALPSGVATSELGRWAHSAIDLMNEDENRECYFSMTGGPGTLGMWAWHGAAELGVHRLDVEAALGHDHAMSDAEAVDALTYVCEVLMPRMRIVTEEDPGSVTVDLLTGEGETLERLGIASDEEHHVSVSGPGVQVLLAMWGRPHVDVEVTSGDAGVWKAWNALPGKAFQFGTWD